MEEETSDLEGIRTGIVRTYKFRIGKSKAQLELKSNKKDI